VCAVKIGEQTLCICKHSLRDHPRSQDQNCSLCACSLFERAPESPWELFARSVLKPGTPPVPGDFPIAELMNLATRLGLFDPDVKRLREEHAAWERFALASLRLVIDMGLDDSTNDSTVKETVSLADALLVEWKKRRPA
jgi:hypothetical protein